MRKNILFGDLIVMDKKKEKTIKYAVFTEGDEYYKEMQIKKVLNYKIVGQTNALKTFSEVKANDEIRNKITGAYE
jgi:hypothetical protein